MVLTIDDKKLAYLVAKLPLNLFTFSPHLREFYQMPI